MAVLNIQPGQVVTPATGDELTSSQIGGDLFVYFLTEGSVEVKGFVFTVPKYTALDLGKLRSIRILGATSITLLPRVVVGAWVPLA